MKHQCYDFLEIKKIKEKPKTTVDWVDQEESNMAMTSNGDKPHGDLHTNVPPLILF
jgi:hypothetical protein